jgi:putative hemolysin
MTVLSPASARAAPRPAPHIIDVLLLERAPKLAASPLWPLLRPLLYALLDYEAARRMADQVAPLRGAPALDLVSRALSLKVETQHAERIPRAGRLVVIANHPTGIGDGLAIYDALRAIRPDPILYANADALRIAPGFADVMIPVEWVEAKRTRAATRLTLKETRRAMQAERALVVFPAGRLARRQPDGRLLDPPWAPTAVSVARRYEAPIAPVHMAGPWSTLFHLFHRLSSELRDITLFHELLNKRGREFRLTVGPLIPPAALAGDAGEVTLRLKHYVETTLAADPDAPFG